MLFRALNGSQIGKHNYPRETKYFMNRAKSSSKYRISLFHQKMMTIAHHKMMK